MKKADEKALLSLLQEKLKEAEAIADKLIIEQPIITERLRYISRIHKIRKRVVKSKNLIQSLKKALS